MKERIEYIDLAKGICIFLVVLDHISDYRYFSDGNYPMNDIFEQTRMPLYFILSGLFFKDYSGGIKEFLLRKTNRILVPYIFFMLTYRVLVRVVYSLADISIGEIWAPLWFLLCLFWMNVIFATLYYIVKRFRHNELMSEIILGAIVLCIGIGGYLAGNLPLNIGTAMTSLPFLWMGYLLNRKLHLFEQRINPWWALLSAFTLFAVLHFLYMGENYFFLNSYSAPLPFVYICGLMGTLAILMLSRVIKWLPVISYIGRYSIIVLCTHMAIVKAVIHIPFNGEFWQNNTVQSLVVLALTIACSVFCCWFLSKYLPWFTAQKDLIKSHLQ